MRLGNGYLVTIGLTAILRLPIYLPTQAVFEDGLGKPSPMTTTVFELEGKMVRKIVVLLAVTAALAACSNAQVSSDHGPQIYGVEAGGV